MTYLINASLPSFWQELETAFDSWTESAEIPSKNEIKTSEDFCTIEVDVPGFKKEDIKISYESNRLLIEAQNKERRLRRAFSLKDSVLKIDDLQAKLELGVLSIKIPKKLKSDFKHFLIN